MTKTATSNGETAVTVARPRLRNGFALSGLRLGGYLGVPATLAALAIIGWFGWTRALPIPDIPIFDLSDVDSELALAIQEAQESVRRSPRSAGAWGQLGMLLHANGFDESALGCYASAARFDKKNPQWPYLAGVLLEVGPNLPEAIGHFERAASLSPPNSMARLRLADALLEQGRLDDADREYRLAAAEDPQDAYALFGLAKLALAQHRYQDSLRLLQAVAGSPLVQNKACVMRACIQQRLGNRAAADDERRQLAELPGDVWKPDDAINQVLQREMGLQPQLNRAQVLWQQRRLEEAITAIQAAVDRYPQSDRAWSHLGLLQAAQGDTVAAERSLQKCLEILPNSSEHRLNLGRLQLSQQRYREALANFEAVMERNPSAGQAHFGIGECREALGNYAGAVTAYDSALKYGPNNETVRVRLERLNQVGGRRSTPPIWCSRWGGAIFPKEF